MTVKIKDVIEELSRYDENLDMIFYHSPSIKNKSGICTIYEKKIINSTDANDIPINTEIVHLCYN